MTKKQFLDGFRSLRSQSTARVGIWTLRREPRWNVRSGWYYYAHQDGEQLRIGGWTSMHTASEVLARKATA